MLSGDAFLHYQEQERGLLGLFCSKIGQISRKKREVLGAACC